LNAHPEFAKRTVATLSKELGAPLHEESNHFEAAAVLRESQVFLSFGYPEGFGLPPAEAMACGRPVLAWASGGPVEVVGDAGVLAAPLDPRGFATQLERLLADPGRRAALGVAARRRAVERYSVERMVREYAELLESLG